MGYPECSHGWQLHLLTKDGWPRCPHCRLRAKAMTPKETAPPKVQPKFDPQMLAANDKEWNW